MKRTASLFVILLVCANTLFGADDEFKPSGSPFAKIFFNTNYNLGDQGSAMELKRAYLGYKYNMTKNFSGKINIDVGSPDVVVEDTLEGKTSYSYVAFIKNAYVTYKTGKLSVDVGMIGVKQVIFTDKIWSHRYIMLPFNNAAKMAPSADLGICATYKFTDFLSADLTVRNGEGYKKVESDDAYQTGFGVTLTPIEGLTLRGFYDYIEREEIMLSMAHLISYKYEGLTLGAEYSTQTNSNDYKGYDIEAIDAFVLYDINDQFEVFLRYNDLNLAEPDGADLEKWKMSYDGTSIIGGIQYAPIKNIKMALNYQGVVKDKVGDSSDRIFLNFQFAF